jgi:hypothetical protein
MRRVGQDGDIERLVTLRAQLKGACIAVPLLALKSIR